MKTVFLAMAIAVVANADNVRFGHLYKRHGWRIPWLFTPVISAIGSLVCYGAAQSTKGFASHTMPLARLAIGVTLLSILGLKLATDAWADRHADADVSLKVGLNEMMFVLLLQLMASLVVGIAVGLCGINIKVASVFMGTVCMLGLYTAAVLPPFLPELRITVFVSTISGILLLMAGIVP